jgi:hypothetical protein
VIGNQDDLAKELFKNGHHPFDDTFVADKEVRFFDVVQSFALAPGQYDASECLLCHRKKFKEIPRNNTLKRHDAAFTLSVLSLSFGKKIKYLTENPH